MRHVQASQEDFTEDLEGGSSDESYEHESSSSSKSGGNVTESDFSERNLPNFDSNHKLKKSHISMDR